MPLRRQPWITIDVVGAAVIHYLPPGGRSPCGAPPSALHTVIWSLVTCHECRGPMAFEPLRPGVEAEH